MTPGVYIVLCDAIMGLVTGHNPPDITLPRSESPVQWQDRIKPTESHIADLKDKFQDWRIQNPLIGGSEPGGYVRGLRPPILKFSLQVGDVWFCGFYPVLPLNKGFWPRGDMSEGGYVRSPSGRACINILLQQCSNLQTVSHQRHNYVLNLGKIWSLGGSLHTGQGLGREIGILHLDNDCNPTACTCWDRCTLTPMVGMFIMGGIFGINVM